MVNALNKARKSNKGFTLVELIIVIAIIAVLAIVIAPQFIQYVENSRIGTDDDAIAQVARAAETVYATTPNMTEQLTIDVVCGNPGKYTVKLGKNNAEFETEIKKIVPDTMTYSFKSKAATGKTVTITVDDKGKASWTTLKEEANKTT